ncbi:thioredoxin-dependent thiol peroxidase [Bartonella ancashensis]|uniref:thioredoxin-dependent peroxiredoxin n=1 Tax=Bartonella ancashensis TaxID=1318743 RepID=A0A0M4LGZ0_9HYPH|nr:thioredoxin-dependent thiol peroxidase [Bartonella ancashensis]ALE03794.1 Thiol peroxidase, Bcp-type [Bartonella ancashensis]
MAQLIQGDIAPDFKLSRDGGNQLQLSSLQGNPVVLYFYPKDDTSGCTNEAVNFSLLKGEFDKIGVTVIGISPDSVEKHNKFKEKHKLDVILVSDEEKNTLQDYGVWVQKSMYGRQYMGVERTTFLIDSSGKIAAKWQKVSVPGHAEKVLEAARELCSRLS